MAFAWLRRLLGGTAAPARAAPPPFPAAPELSSRSLAELARDLDGIDTFATGPVGIAAMTSPGESIAREIAARPDGVAVAEQLVASGGPAARLYALWILGQRAPDVAARHADRLGSDPAQVWSMTGCIKMPSTVAAEVQRLRANTRSS